MLYATRAQKCTIVGMIRVFVPCKVLSTNSIPGRISWVFCWYYNAFIEGVLLHDNFILLRPHCTLRNSETYEVDAKIHANNVHEILRL